MIGIICAMEKEIALFRESMESAKTETISGVEYTVGKLFGKDAVIARCGIGKVFAAICAQTMILTYHPDLILNSGVAGTLTDALSVGQIALSSEVVQHDMDTSPIGDPVGLLSGINRVYLPADAPTAERLFLAADRVGLHAEIGRIASGDQFICDLAKKQYIVSTFGAIACEMEGAAIGHVCFVNGVPFCIIRGISDGGDENAQMDYPTFVGIASEHSFRLIRAFMQEN